MSKQPSDLASFDPEKVEYKVEDGITANGFTSYEMVVESDKYRALYHLAQQQEAKLEKADALAEAIERNSMVGRIATTLEPGYQQIMLAAAAYREAGK